jgi:hypothetical protein
MDGRRWMGAHVMATLPIVYLQALPQWFLIERARRIRQATRTIIIWRSTQLITLDFQSAEIARAGRGPCGWFAYSDGDGTHIVALPR